MIGVLGGKDMAALQRKAADLEQQLEALSARMLTMGEQFATVHEQLEAATRRADEQAAELTAELTKAARRTEALAAIVADQAAAIGRLDGREDRRKELDGRVRADLVRLEHQAATDVAELRQTALALAERLLLAGR